MARLPRQVTRVKTEEYEGAARLHVKTVEEMAQDKELHRKMASAANKGVIEQNN